jgi:predicted nucleic acid-binding protein
VRVDLDSAPIIYLVEDILPYTPALVSRLSAPNMIQVCSELSRLECRVKPIRDGEEALLAAFDSYFGGIVNEVLPLSCQVLERATLLRARYGFRIPDAIHLAAAIDGDCDLFLTNDSQLARCQEITVEAV